MSVHPPGKPLSPWDFSCAVGVTSRRRYSWAILVVSVRLLPTTLRMGTGSKSSVLVLVLVQVVVVVTSADILSLLGSVVAVVVPWRLLSFVLLVRGVARSRRRRHGSWCSRY